MLARLLLRDGEVFPLRLRFVFRSLIVSDVVDSRDSDNQRRHVG